MHSLSLGFDLKSVVDLSDFVLKLKMNIKAWPQKLGGLNA